MAAAPPARPTGNLVKPPEFWVKRWYENARRAVDAYREGVQAPRRNPIEAAVANADVWHARVSAPETKEKWKARLSSVKFEDWLNAVLNKGAARYPNGIEFGKTKYERFAKAFHSHLEEGVRRVLAIPKRTLEDAIRRAAEMIRWNAKFTFRG